jgi:Carboxypeptidase regulatory-like domain
MKKNRSTRSAFFIPRFLIGLVLILGSVVIALFAFGLAPLNNFGKPATLPAGKGGGGPVSKSSRNQVQGAQSQTTIAYSGPRKDLRPVSAVHTAPLRHMPAIPPRLAPAPVEREPIRPRPPTDATGPDLTAQTFAGALVSAPTPTGVSFEGVGAGIPGFVISLIPPDTNGRIGATQYVQWNNASFAIWDKTGKLLYGPVAGNTLFQPLGGACATHNDGDPVVAYDILSGRWILSQFVVGASPDFSHQCVAVSATGDALGSYYLYDFVTDSANFVDYPKIGVWPDGYYMTGHVFNAAGTSYLAGRIFVFERDKMLQGLPARQLQKDLKKYAGKSQYGFLPSDLDSLTPPPAGAAAFVIGPDPVTTQNLDSTRVAVTWGATPTITLTETRISATWSLPPCVGDPSNVTNFNCVPQPSPATQADYVDNLYFHLMYRLPYRNFGGNPVQESLVANITNKGSASNPAHGAIRWFEFRNAGSSTTAPTVFQASTYDPDTAYRWMGSIAMDKDHNIALGYSKSSTSIKPGIYITGRLGNDPLNTMGAEAPVTAGSGVQIGANPFNRWGDYSAMTLDPIDQCTFFYTNEYYRNQEDGDNENWATRIASYRFESCVAAPAWGTVTGTVISSPSKAPLSGVLVTLNNGYAGATNANGVYSILVPAGTYTATAADPDRNCTEAKPASATVTVTSGGTTTQNFSMTGGSNLESNGVTIDDSTSGNGNSVINKNECVNLNIALKNNGCANERSISATLTTTTPGVTITQGSSSYPNLVIDASGANTTPFQLQTSSSFACGTDIALNLNLTYASGNKTIPITVPTCTGGANQTIPLSSLTASDLTQSDRLGRDGSPSTCAGKGCPGGGFAGTKFYKTYNFSNTGAGPACITVTINAKLEGAGDIESAAYLNSYNPANLCQNYLGDSGVVGLGTTIPNASYSFTVPAKSNFVVVVNTTGTTTSSEFSGTVSGFFDDTAGPGPCPTP